MKKIFQLLSTTTGLPLTGRDIALVRVFPNDGVEVSCAALGSTGSYLANPIDAGLYKVFDRTGGANPGTDLDQTVDVAAVTLTEPSLGNPTSGFLAAPDKEFRGIEKTDVSGLNADLVDLDTRINNAAAAILVEINNRTADDLRIQTSVTEAVSALNAGLASQVQSDLNKVSLNKMDKLELWCEIVYNGANIDFSQSGYSTYMDTGGIMIFTAEGAQIAPADVIPEVIKAKFESPTTVNADTANSHWSALKPLASGVYPHPPMPSLEITERVKSILFYFDETANAGGRTFRAALRVVQSADFDSFIEIVMDLSNTEMIESQFIELYFLVFDGSSNKAIRFSFDKADLFNKRFARKLVRLRRASGVLYCGIIEKPLPYKAFVGAY